MYHSIIGARIVPYLRRPYPSVPSLVATTATTFEKEESRAAPFYLPRNYYSLASTACILPSIISLPTVRAFSIATGTTAAGIPTQTMTTTSSSVPERPSLPFRYYVDANENTTQQLPTLDLSELSQQISVTYQERQNMYEISRNIQNSIQQIRNHIGTDAAQQEIQTLIETYSTKLPNQNSSNDMDSENSNNSNKAVVVLTHDKATNRVPRIANLSHTIEDLMRTISYQHFLQTGRVLPPPLYVTDEEYLAGAIMGLCSDLQSYGLGRATVRDRHSVQLACRVVTASMEYLLSFDFRNGSLRRKYDGCKYSLKALETFLYELAVTSPSTGLTGTTPPPLQLEDILPMKELTALKERIEFRDDLRETLIKKCRDGQKLAKQCIFAMHRNPTDRVTPRNSLQQCSKYILEDLFPIVHEEPPLRYGSFASVLEEYVEAKLFYTWLHGRDDDRALSTSRETDPKPTSSVSGIILVPQDFMMDEMIELQPEEYMGGLCDLTGEIGRFAVQRGTVRDVASIKQCLYSNTIIFNAIQSMDRMSSYNGGGGASKKLDTVRQNVQKIERMLYEISLSEAAGHGRTIHTDAPIATTTGLVSED